jgi:hypothetical protein
MFEKMFMLWPEPVHPMVFMCRKSRALLGKLERPGSGQRIEIVDTRWVSQKGTFLKFSEDALWLQVGEEEVVVQRPGHFASQFA